MTFKLYRRYTLALYGEAINQKLVDSAGKDAQFVLDTIQRSRELELFFKSPIISKEKKQAVIKAVFGGKVSKLMENFLQVLVIRQREQYVSEILQDFLQYKNKMEGRVEVSVTTAVDLTDDERRRMKETIDRYTHLNSEPSFSVDKDIIGGFIVNIKDTILDASLKHQLEILRKKFKQGDIALN